MSFYFAAITPLIAGVIAIYAIFPDLLANGASARRRLIAGSLIALGTITSVWSAYSAAKDHQYLASWQAIQSVHETVNRIWRDYQEWPAPGSEDTEFGVLMEPEVRHGEAEVYAGVQA